MQQQKYSQQYSQTRQKYQFTHAQMHNYFIPLSVFYGRLSLAGLCVLIMGFWSASSSFTSPIAPLFYIVGAGLLTWGIIPILIHEGSKPNYKDYENWVQERTQSLYKEALRRLNIDESKCESIVEVEGGISSLHQLTKKFPEKEIIVKRLSNDHRHYSINIAMYIFLMKDKIAIYSGYVNALAQSERFEDADHYYYQDVVAVSVSGPVYQGLFSRGYERQGVLVRINNGDSIGTDYATKVISWNGNRTKQIEGANDVVAALLALIYEHKLSPIEASKITRDLP